MKHLGWSRYVLQFTGSVLLDRPLQPGQAAYLQRFLSMRRVSWSSEYVQTLLDPLREAVGLPVGVDGAYFVGLSFEELKGDERQPLVLNQSLKQNDPPQGQPDLRCHWTLDQDGMTLRYGAHSGLYFCSAWLRYLIDHFLAPWGYQLHGEIAWQGDDDEDQGRIVVIQNQISQWVAPSSAEKHLARPHQPIVCAHQDARATRLVCAHLANRSPEVDYSKWFSGQGKVSSRVCLSCAERIKQGETTIPLQQICWRCYREITEEGCREGIVGMPEVLVRSTNLSIVRQSQPFPLSGRILAIQPVDMQQEGIWLALLQDGHLVELNLTANKVTPLLHVSGTNVNFEEEIDMHVAPDGHVVAIANTHGQYGIVLDLRTGTILMHLERDTYHIKHCRFPLAFWVYKGRLLLVPGTRWHRLDISDPLTGELLTTRTYVKKEGQRHPEHYLDYFRGGLSVSPDQQWIADNGWIWHPMGAVFAWNMQRWLQENPWESEDGHSLLDLCQRAYYWDGPLCWLDARTIAVWGYGDDDEWLIPAVRLFDVVAEKEVNWFAGPEGTLVYDEYLFALSEKQGLTAWDLATGERVLADPAFHPTHYHRGAKHFLQIDAQRQMLHLGKLVL